MDEAIYTAKVNECAEVDKGADSPLTDLPLLKLRQECFTHFRLGLLKVLTAGQDNIIAVLVKLKYFSLDLLPDIRRQVTYTAHLNEGCGKEAAKANINDEATLNSFNNGTFNNTVSFLDFLYIAPCTLILCTLLGKDKASVLIFLGNDQGFDSIADFDNVFRGDIFFDGEFF